MPEFLLRYKIPDDAHTDFEVEEVKDQAQLMAKVVQAVVRSVFFGWKVSYEVREFSLCSEMPDIYVTGWVTKNKDVSDNLVELAQEEVIKAMVRTAYTGQTVGCSWQMVNGKWGTVKVIRD